MVGYEGHNIHFRKSCAHFKIFHSVEILYCKLSPAHVRVCACVCVCVCLCFCFQNLNNSQLHQRTESSGMHRNTNDNLPRVGYHRRWLEFLPPSLTCWVHLEMPTMIIVACSWVSSIRNSVGNPTHGITNSRFSCFILAFPSMIDYDQLFPTILNVATTKNFWLGLDVSGCKYTAKKT